jgi:hypothetical protein
VGASHQQTLLISPEEICAYFKQLEPTLLSWRSLMSALRQADGREKRGAARYRVLSQATLMAKGSKHFCVVRDLSETGAKLGVSETVKLPEQFELSFASHPVRLEVRLMWRSGNFAGVQFAHVEQAKKVVEESQDKILLPD